MKILKRIMVAALSFLAVLTILFYQYTSFVDKLDIVPRDKTDFIHPSKLLIKYEVFISGTILRPAYRNFVQGMHLTGSEKILDFGSGAGGEAIHLAETIRGKSGSLTCLDISHSWLQVARNRLSSCSNVDYIEGNLLEINMQPASYDVIVLRLVLHDIPGAERKALIERFNTILKPGGCIFIYEPAGKGHAIDVNGMRSLFHEAGFSERYLKQSFSLVMFPPRSMAEAVYCKSSDYMLHETTAR